MLTGSNGEGRLISIMLLLILILSLNESPYMSVKGRLCTSQLVIEAGEGKSHLHRRQSRMRRGDVNIDAAALRSRLLHLQVAPVHLLHLWLVQVAEYVVAELEHRRTIALVGQMSRGRL